MTDQPKPKRDPNAITLHATPGADPDELAAEVAVRPAAHAAVTIRQIVDPKNQADLTFDALITELQRHGDAVRGGDLTRQEAMLAAQADTLDALTHTLLRRALLQTHLPYLESFARLALKAQSQCRATLETLAAIKNPPIVYARQANIAAGPQQVNNGPLANGTRTRKTETTPTKLSGASHELLPDTRASAHTVGGNPPLEAVGALDRAENARG